MLHIKLRFLYDMVLAIRAGRWRRLLAVFFQEGTLCVLWMKRLSV